MPCFPAQCSYLEVASGLCPCLSEKACLTLSKSSLITHTFCMRESPEVPAPPQHEVLVLFFFFNWSKVGTLLCLSECSQPQGLPFFFGEQRDEAMGAREGKNMAFVDYISPKPYWVLIAIVSIAEGKVGHFRSYGDHDRALICGGRLLLEE